MCRPYVVMCAPCLAIPFQKILFGLYDYTIHTHFGLTVFGSSLMLRFMSLTRNIVYHTLQFADEPFVNPFDQSHVQSYCKSYVEPYAKLVKLDVKPGLDVQSSI